VIFYICDILCDTLKDVTYWCKMWHIGRLEWRNPFIPNLSHVSHVSHMSHLSATRNARFRDENMWQITKRCDICVIFRICKYVTYWPKYPYICHKLCHKCVTFCSPTKMSHITLFLLVSWLRWQWKYGYSTFAMRHPWWSSGSRNVIGFARFSIVPCLAVRARCAKLIVRSPLSPKRLFSVGFIRVLCSPCKFRLIVRFPATSDPRTLHISLVLQGFPGFLA